ncbi:Uncharacterised protein [Mycobacteroides abscessus subsp. abscessus]|nr:Uncharacterised protein [Mycobacteroides abscessus subsp. abscessus]SIA73848.1 Uncharacterised protein [Mycobacteroides abscessus subsp. abscessus]SKW36420.1 Uncharacterised protein [Mycobacteroides abscessus subsp. abscessus]
MVDACFFRSTMFHRAFRRLSRPVDTFPNSSVTASAVELWVFRKSFADSEPLPSHKPISRCSCPCWRSAAAFMVAVAFLNSSRSPPNVFKSMPASMSYQSNNWRSLAVRSGLVIVTGDLPLPRIAAVT